MEHESPVMKAWREFVLADPNDCDQEYDAYMELVNKTATTSVSSPTNSTSSLVPGTTTKASSATSAPAHPRVPRDNAFAAILTAPAASHAVRSSEDDLSPEARRIYEYIVGNSEELTSTASLPVPTSGGISESGVAIATPKRALHSLTPSTCSTVCLGTHGDVTPKRASASANTCISRPATTHDWSLSCGVTENSISPAAIHVSTNICLRMEFNAVQDAVDLDAADLVAPAPTACSMECPSHEASAFAAALMSCAIQNWSATTGGITLEPAVSELSDKAVDLDLTGDSAPSGAICLPGSPDHGNIREDPMSVSLTPWNVHTTLNEHIRNLPRPLHGPLIVPELFTWSRSLNDCSCRSIKTSSRLLNEAYKEFKSTVAPWPPPCAGTPLIHGQDLFHHMRQKRVKEFSVQDTKGNWHEIWLSVDLKPPWPSLGVCMPPMGYALFSLGSIAANDDDSTDLNSCLDDVLWKLPRWRSDNQFVRPYKSICDVTSRLWITSRLAEVQFQFSYPLVPVSTHFGTGYFQLSRRSQMNVDSNSGSILVVSMSQNDPFLSSADVHQEFMRIYSVTAVVSRSTSWPCYQDVTGNMILLLPDPGLPLSGIDTMFSTLVDGLSARVRSHSEFTCLQGDLIYELFSCSFVIELIKKGMVALEEQQPCTSWRCVSLLQPKPPWSHIAPTSPPIELMSDLRNVSKSLYISGNSFELHMTYFAAWHVFCARFRLKIYYSVHYSCSLTSHFIQRAYLLMQWKILGLFSCAVVPIISWLQFATQNSFDPSCDQIVTEGTTYLGCQLFQWRIPWYTGLYRATSSSNWLQMQLVGGHVKIHVAFFFSWEVTSTIDSVLAIKNISGRSTVVLKYLEVENSLVVPMPLLSNHQSEVWVLYLHVTYIVQCWHKLMTSEIARSEDDSLTCTTRVLISWDPGGLNPVFALAWIITQLQYLHRAWDPGIWALLCFCGVFAQAVAKGEIMVEAPIYFDYHYIVVFLGQASLARTTSSTWDRLAVKPNFMEEGLSTTSLDGLACGPSSWAVACSRTGCGGGTETYILAQRPQRDWAWNRTERRLRPRLG